MEDTEQGQYSHAVEDAIRAKLRVTHRRYLGTRSLLAVIGVLLLLSILSSVFTFKGIHSGQQRELEFDLFDNARATASRNNQIAGWRVINLTDSAETAPQNTIFRRTLAEAFFTPECAEAWVATGTLCDKLMERGIPLDIQTALKLSTIHTWVNGSDVQLQGWKEALAKGQQSATQARTRIGNLARHFRYRANYQSMAAYTLTLGLSDHTGNLFIRYDLFYELSNQKKLLDFI